MIAEISKVSDARVQSFGLEFHCEKKIDKLLVTASCQFGNMNYIGEIPVHPEVDFDEIKKVLDEGYFKILTKTEENLKIQIEGITIELISKTKSQINQLKSIINQQKKINDEHGLLITELKTEVEKLKSTPRISIKMMEELKSDVAGKLQGMRQNLESQTFAMKIAMNQQSKIISDEQKKIREFSFKLKGVQKEIQLLNNMRNEIKELKSECKNLEEFAKKQMNDLKSLVSNQSVVIDEVKTTFSKKIIEQNEIINNHETKKEFVHFQEKLNSLQLKLNELSNDLGENIQKVDIIWKTVKCIAKGEQQNLLIISGKWSQKLKSNAISINKNTLTLNLSTGYYDFCLLDSGFSQKLKHQQSWGIKIKKKTKGIYIGVCLQNKIRKYNFNSKGMKWNQEGHGLYLIGSGGKSYSHSQQHYNGVEKNNFKFGVNDVIFVEYDPIGLELRFSKNKDQSFEMPITEPTQDNEYYPCVLLGGQNDSVELI